jgi:hypothetical protein
MGRFVAAADRSQMTFLPECLDDWVGEDNPVHVIEAFVEALDLTGLGFGGVIAKATGRPSYHPAVLLRLCGRWQQVQGGKQPRQELHVRQDGEADRSGRGEHCALPASTR